MPTIEVDFALSIRFGEAEGLFTGLIEADAEGFLAPHIESRAENEGAAFSACWRTQRVAAAAALGRIMIEAGRPGLDVQIVEIRRLA